MHRIGPIPVAYRAVCRLAIAARLPRVRRPTVPLASRISRIRIIGTDALSVGGRGGGRAGDECGRGGPGVRGFAADGVGLGERFSASGRVVVGGGAAGPARG